MDRTVEPFHHPILGRMIAVSMHPAQPNILHVLWKYDLNFLPLSVMRVETEP